eukprot:TRINITY_DN1422_c0_g1_i2.p1 TRINITY_DN1422_c0_g1~~TRINITY_DN1422_c0_g1_i2.p1  ORF type:complete len:518 (+),score=149.17 TRINITY_DN1422_c0_g1_i2:41-1594(+)
MSGNSQLALQSLRETFKSGLRSTRNVLPDDVIRPVFSDLYVMGKKLGAGQFGTTHLCEEKATGKRFAVKVIDTGRLHLQREVDDIRREVAILYHAQDQPDILNIQSVHEDKDHVYIVTDLCSGGELFASIIDRAKRFGVPFSEKEAAHVGRQVVQIVERCHALSIVHRDLKPENFLWSDKTVAAHLVAIDFGLAAFCDPEGLRRPCGSLLYMAPEVVAWSKGAYEGPTDPPPYDHQADVWSAGVVIFALLCGYAPFGHKCKTKEDMWAEIFHKDVNFNMRPWPGISECAKDLIRKMLTKDPKKRPTAHEVLCHPWLADPNAPRSEPLPPVVASRLKQFSGMVKFKKMVMQLIATNLSEDEIGGLREMFLMLDADGSGSITLKELVDGLKKIGAKFSEAEFEEMFNETDFDHNGTIEYEEFLAGTANLSKVHQQSNLLKAFHHLDVSGDGSLSLDELKAACKKLRMREEDVEQMMKEADLNHDGKIDYHEFVASIWDKSGKAVREDSMQSIHLGTFSP